MPIDQFSDPSFKTLALRVKENPEFIPLIKHASIDAEDQSSLPSSAFAWSDRRMYPYHTPEHATLSYLYATDKTASVPADVLETLKTALDVYGITVPTEKVAAAQEDNLDEYVLPEKKRWRVTSPETVKLAENALREYGDDLSVEERVSAARRLVKKAEQYGTEVDLSTVKNAGLLASDIDTVRHWVEARASVADETHAPMYAKVAELLQKSDGASHDKDSLVKLASTIHELDKQSNIFSRTRKPIPDAMSTVFNTTKVAENMVDVAGKSVSLAKLANLPEHVYSDIFGKDFLDEIKTAGRLDTRKLAEVLPTMPMDLKKIFNRQMGPYIR